jgi:DNA-binding XRE family transcriptional regulator
VLCLIQNARCARLGPERRGNVASMEAKFIKELREKAGYSQAEAAVLADCAINTWRTFEVAPDAVTPKTRKACERALDVIRQKAQAA